MHQYFNVFIVLFLIYRADIKQYIGPPSEQAIFSIYHSCINELKKVNENSKFLLLRF